MLFAAYGLVTFQIKSKIILQIAENAPHSTLAGGAHVAVCNFFILCLCVVHVFSVKFFFYFAPGGLYEKGTDYISYGVFGGVVLTAIAATMLFLVSNQILYDRCKNFTRSLRTMSMSDMMEPKEVITQYLDLVDAVERMQSAWNFQALCAVVIMVFSTFASIIIFILFVLAGPDRYFLEVLQETFPITMVGGLGNLLLSTISRWNEIPRDMCVAVTRRFRELSSNPGVSERNLECILNVIRGTPIEWLLNFGYGAARVSYPVIILYFVMGFVGNVGVIIVTTTSEEKFCNIGLGDSVSAGQVGHPEYNSAPFNISKIRHTKEVVSDMSYVLSYHVSTGFVEAPDGSRKERYRIFSCQIVGCETVSRLMYPAWNHDVTGVACMDMFTLINNTEKYNAPFTTYNLRVNTDKEVWKQSAYWMKVMQGFTLLLSCRTELGERTHRFCMETGTRVARREYDMTDTAAVDIP